MSVMFGKVKFDYDIPQPEPEVRDVLVSYAPLYENMGGDGGSILLLDIADVSEELANQGESGSFIAAVIDYLKSVSDDGLTVELHIG